MQLVIPLVALLVVSALGIKVVLLLEILIQLIWSEYVIEINLMVIFKKQGFNFKSFNPQKLVLL